MNILIIGNGFDIAHKLPTKCTDFLKYCREYSEDNPVSNSNDMNKEFLSFISDNIWLKYFLKSTPSLDNPKTWIDFEKEIAEIIENLEVVKPTVAPSSEASSEIILGFLQNGISVKLEMFFSSSNVFDNKTKKDAMGKRYKYIITNNNIMDTKTLIDFIYDQLRTFTRAFEIFCLLINTTPITEIIKRIPTTEATKINREIHISEIKPIYYLSLSKFDCVLSFNYTDTYKRLYGSNNTKYCYIHGKAQDDKSKTDIILGIDDDLPQGEESQNFTWVRFKKYYQRIILKTGSEYKDWLEFYNKQNIPHYTAIFYVHIVGHSLDETDYDILYEIFSNNQSKIIIYYYCPDDFEEKVQKVIKLLACKGGNGRDELIRRVHGTQWSIKFVDQYDEKKGLFIKNYEEENDKVE